MSGPLTVTHININMDSFFTLNGVKLFEDGSFSTTDPSGGRVWACALTACHALTTRLLVLPSKTKPIRILDLSAGTGLCGITAALHSPPHANVIMTEIADWTSNLSRNCTLNGLCPSQHVREFEWGQEDAIESLGGAHSFDVIVMSDLLHWPGCDLLAPDTLPLLVWSLDALLSYERDAVGLLVYSKRHEDREARFLAMCQERGFEMCVIADCEAVVQGVAKEHVFGSECEVVQVELRRRHNRSNAVDSDELQANERK